MGRISPQLPNQAVERARRSVTSAGVLLLALVAVSARAAGPAPVVVLETDGPAEQVQLFTASLEDWGRSQQVQWVGAADAPAARVRAQWSSLGVRVQVFRGADGLVRDKQVPLEGAPLVVTESAALLAHAALEEVLAASPAAPAEPSAPRAPLTPPALVKATVPDEPVQAPQPFARLVLGASFLARTYDAELPVAFGAGADATLSFLTGDFCPTVTLLASYQGPVSDRGDAVPLTVHLQTVGVRLLPGVERRFGALTVGLQGGGGLDVLFAEATAGEGLPSARLVPSRVDAAPFFTVALAARVQLAASVTFSLRLLADLDPAPRRYTALGEHLLEPWSVRPGLQLGFDFDLALGAR